MAMGWRVRVLGDVALSSDAQHDIPIPSRRQRAILAVLVAADGQPVSGDALLDAVWEGDTPATSLAALHTQLSRLRRVFSTAGIADDDMPIQRTTTGYAFRAPTANVDAWEFRRAVTSAPSLAAPERVEVLTDALALWRGRAFAEFSDLDPVLAVAAALDEQRVRAGELLAEALADSGRHADAVLVLERINLEHPLRESTVQLLMRSLHGDARTREALDRFQAYRIALGAELGLEPSAALQELERSLLQGGPAPGASRSRSSAGPQRSPSTFVGRAGDLESVQDALVDAPMLTLVGPAGVGKTRLALEVCHQLIGRFPDGVSWCDLASVPGDEVPVAIATALGLDERSGTSLVDRLASFLADRSLLLILDNSDLVAAEIWRLAQRVLSSSPASRVLVTSRTPIGVDGERRHRVLPLGVPDDHEMTEAMELLLDRASRAGFTPHDDGRDAPLLAAICRRLDGLPLALELAAPRLTQMPAEDLLAQLGARHTLVSRRPRGQHDRHDSLDVALDWTRHLLDPTASVLLDRLSCFRSAFAIADAVAACSGTPVGAADVPDLLAELVDHSLVTYRHQRHAPYELLEAVRVHGRQRLEASGELAHWEQSHARSVCTAVEVSDAQLRTADEERARLAIEDRFTDIRAAIQWSEAHDAGVLGATIVATLHWYSLFRTGPEPARWAERIVDRTPDATADLPRPLLAAVASFAALGASKRGAFDRARELTRRAIEIDPDGGHGHAMEGQLHLHGGDLAAAIEHARIAIRHHEARGEHTWAAVAATTEVLALAFDDEHDRAVERSTELLAAAARLGSPSLQAMSSYCAGEAERLDIDNAERHFRRSVDLARSVGADFVVGLSTTALAALRIRRGDAFEIVELLSSAVDEWQRTGVWNQQWLTLRLLIEVAASTEHWEDVAMLSAAFESSQTAGPAYGVDRERLAEAVASARSGLGSASFEHARRQGSHLGDDAAVTLARRLLKELATSAKAV